MNIKNKTVAITGCTGGLGRELCFNLAAMGANLIMLDRNPDKSAALEKEILSRYSGISVLRITTELEDMASVIKTTEGLTELKPDIFIANAGAYSIPRHITDNGYENIFQINFVSPYYMVRSLCEVLPDMRIVAVGSIAHTYSQIDENDIDFRTRNGSALPYGNSKRFLMLSLSEYFKATNRLSVVHPGITFTNITAHYPKLIFAVIKHPMKLIFMKPKKAVNCIIEGVLSPTPAGSWIGPRLFRIWGKPRMQNLKAYFTEDTLKASEIADEIYKELKKGCYIK